VVFDVLARVIIDAAPARLARYFISDRFARLREAITYML